METRVKPILFSSPMIRAILEGKKTQTRRALNPQPVALPSLDPGGSADCMWSPGLRNPLYHLDLWPKLAPFGEIGDQLWVREAWKCHWGSEYEYQKIPGSIEYRATHDSLTTGSGPWKPSIHMPRWASRITLKITGVRVERLQAISERDALLEGMSGDYLTQLLGREPEGMGDLSHAYKTLWEQINGPESWELNPWVWVIEFERIK